MSVETRSKLRRRYVGELGGYFLTCECFGKKFVKLGRSSDVASRRRELQSGCPFELVIEHVQPMDEREAIERERRYRTLLRTMEQRLPQDTRKSFINRQKTNDPLFHIRRRDRLPI